MVSLVRLFLFLFGLAVGSFMNVVVYRLNHGLSPFKGRSFCPKCKKKILWQDNIPLLSFVLLRGKCRYCRSPISWQYPLVELATGVFTVLVVQLHLRGDPSQFPKHLGGVLYYLLITYTLIALFASDFRYQTIPDEIVYPAIGLALLYSAINHQPSTISHIFSGLGAAAFFLALVLITKGRGMGMGDVKLAGLMGLVLGFPKIVVALMLAFLTGAGAGVILILLGKKHFGEHIPFGPFLTGATWLSLFWGGEIIAFYLSRLGI